MPLACRDIEDTRDPVFRGIDPVQLSVIRFDGKEIISYVNHAVPGPVRLKIRRVRKHGIQGIPNELNISHPAHKATAPGIGLT